MYHATERSQLCDFIIQMDDRKFGKLYKWVSTHFTLPREYTTDDFNEETLEAIREAEKNRHKKKRYADIDEMMTDILGEGWQHA